MGSSVRQHGNETLGCLNKGRLCGAVRMLSALMHIFCHCLYVDIVGTCVITE